MDHELIAYLDRRFGAVSQHLGRIDQRLDGMDQRLDGIDQRLDGIDQRLDGIDRRIDRVEGRLGRVESRLDYVEGQVRQVYVVVEGLDHKIQLVAEGVTTVGERLERYRHEAAEATEESRSLTRLAFRHLDRRTTRLETRAGRWDRRLDALGAAGGP
jgi:archaellum component FlaC